MVLCFCVEWEKRGIKLKKTNKLTLRCYGDLDDLKIYYRLKLGLPFSPLELAFYKNIATNDDYRNNY